MIAGHVFFIYLNLRMRCVMKSLLRFSILFCCSGMFLAFGSSLYAQDQTVPNLPYDIWMSPSTLDFHEIQRQAEEYFEGRDQGRGTGYKQWKRWEYMMNDRLTTDGKITNYAARNMEAHRLYSKTEAQYQQEMRTYGGFWFQEASDGYILGNSGYNPGIGRVNVIAFHPTSQSTIYAGTPAGGLWRTTNEGTSWTPLTDGIPRIGVSGIVVDPVNPNIIYILTGDGDGSDTFCIGVLRTTDGGATWNPTGLSFNETQFVRGYKLAVKPDDNNILFAVTTQGIYRTLDAGVNWTLVQSGSFRDLEFRPQRPDTIYACTASTFYRSLNGGNTWTIISTGLPTGENRSALAVTPANANYVYYLAGPGGPQGQFKGLYRSTNSGASFSTVTTTPNILDSSVNGNASCNNNGCVGQAAYDLAIAVDPNDDDVVITGGINVWRNAGIDAGQSWTIISHWNTNTQQNNNLQYTHADIHELVYQDNSRLWCGSDGGVFRSTNDGVTWSDRTSAGSDNGLISTQWYRIAGTPQNNTLLIGGTQDNGSNRWTGTNDITHFDGADGMDCMIDFTNSSIQYHCRQNGGLRKSTNSGSTHSSIRPGNSNGAWVTPIRMDPSNNTEIWAGYNDTIYRSTNSGSTWTGFIPLAGSGFFRYIYCPPSNSQVIYAATNTRLFRSGNNGTSWTNVTGTLPVGQANITGITTDIDNSNDVWVSFSGYAAGQKIYFSSDGGTSWTNVSGSLPNVPVNCVIYDDAQTNDNSVYVGTDIGIFYRDNGLSDWVPFRNGLPNVPVFDMHVSTGNNKLYAGTYGRGLWSSNLYSECPAGWNLTDANAPGTFPEGFRYYQANTFITSTRNLYGGAGTEEHYKAGNYVQLNEGFRARVMDVFRAWIGPCAGGIPQIPLTGDPAEEEYALQLNIPDDRHQTIAHAIGAPETPLLIQQTISVALDHETGTLQLSANERSEVRLRLYRDGVEVEHMLAPISVENGTRSVPLHTHTLKPGDYRLIVSSGGREQSAFWLNVIHE